MDRAAATLKHITPALKPSQGEELAKKLLLEGNWPHRIRVMLSYAHTSGKSDAEIIEFVEHFMDVFAKNAGPIYPELTDYCGCDYAQDFHTYIDHELSEYGIWYHCPVCHAGAFFGSALDRLLSTKTKVDKKKRRSKKVHRIIETHQWYYDEPIEKRPSL